MPKIPLPPPTQLFVKDDGRLTEVWYRVISRLANAPSPVDKVSANITSTSSGQVAIGEFPAGAIHIATYVQVNSTSARELIVGTSADTDHFVTTGDVVLTSTGMTVLDRAIGETYAQDTMLYAQYMTTGDAPDVDIALVYLTEN